MESKDTQIHIKYLELASCFLLAPTWGRRPHVFIWKAETSLFQWTFSFGLQSCIFFVIFFPFSFFSPHIQIPRNRIRGSSLLPIWEKSGLCPYPGIPNTKKLHHYVSGESRKDLWVSCASVKKQQHFIFALEHLSGTAVWWQYTNTMNKWMNQKCSTHHWNNPKQVVTFSGSNMPFSAVCYHPRKAIPALQTLPLWLKAKGRDDVMVPPSLPKPYASRFDQNHPPL